MSERAPIIIDVVSDVVCPWCYVGQRNLQLALDTVGNTQVSVRWRPYQLDPTLPPEGVDRQTYIQQKFGSAERVQAIHERLEHMGAEIGITFNFDAIKVAPNTLDAHRVIRWAGDAGQDVQDRLVQLLFQLNFEKGENIGDHAVLIEAAREAGMDASMVEKLLPTATDKAEVQAEIAQAQRMGVTGVPCFLLEGRYALTGAQPAEVLADAIVNISEAKARGELESA